MVWAVVASCTGHRRLPKPTPMYTNKANGWHANAFDSGISLQGTYDTELSPQKLSITQPFRQCCVSSPSCWSKFVNERCLVGVFTVITQVQLACDTRGNLSIKSSINSVHDHIKGLLWAWVQQGVSKDYSILACGVSSLGEVHQVTKIKAADNNAMLSFMSTQSKITAKGDVQCRGCTSNCHLMANDV